MYMVVVMTTEMYMINTDSKDRCILVVRDPAMRALVLQAIEEQARTS
jgi:hypothetical protein